MEIAVIQTGGKQYKVAKDSVVKIEKLSRTDGGDYKEGDKVVFDQVLLLGDKIGTPLVDKAKVTGTITKIGRNAKVTVIKFKQKSKYFKKNGHRQPYFQVKIDALK